MKILLIEDNRRFADDLIGALRDRIVGIDVRLAVDYGDAQGALQDQDYDLVACDLRLPHGPGSTVEDVALGLEMYQRARASMPGTPIVVFSAYGTLDIVRDLYESSPQEDAYVVGRANTHLSSFFQKDQLPEFIEHVEELAAGLARIEAIDITFGGVEVPLTQGRRRVLKIFARRREGVTIRVASLTGGLSETEVLRVHVGDRHGGVLSAAVARLGDISSIQSEKTRYQQLVHTQLGSGAFAHLIDDVCAGAGNCAGAFYWFAGEGAGGTAYDTLLFDLLPDNDARAEAAVSRLAVKLMPWVEASHQKEVTVESIRKLLLSDEDLAALSPDLPFDPSDVESQRVYVRFGPEHGDLHGLNVLVRADDDPVLIDFGSLCSGPTALDPLTLELSMLFHPRSPLAIDEGDAPDLSDWFDDEKYVGECRSPAFAKACREWLRARAATDAEVAALAYAYALRQMRYPHAARKAAALKLAETAAERLLAR